MFKSLASKFGNIFSALSNKSITEGDIENALTDIKSALLEADVAPQAVTSFASSLKEKFAGENVIKKTNPLQTIVKLTQDEISAILSQNHAGLIQKNGLLTIMAVGLQGSGKTTSMGKLALQLKNEGKKVLLASLDVRRPAAQEQLAILAEKAGVSSLEIIKDQNPIEITKRAIKQASDFDVLILDTAGRSQVEEELMTELEDVKKIAKPDEILLVMDSLFGRQSLALAQSFDERLLITGVILTRMESDTRGGIAFNIKHSLKKPIKFCGTGEKLEDFEEFHPERISNRILDMGDIVSLVEKAKKIIDEKEAEKMQQKMAKGNFDFNDFLKQIKSMRKMGGLGKIMAFIPGASKFAPMMGDDKQKEIYRQEAIILSMTKKEREKPDILINSNSRKSRVAKGSGVKLIEVNKLLKQFEGMKMMFGKMGKIDQNTLSNAANIQDLMKLLK